MKNYWDSYDKCKKVAIQRQKSYGNVVENFKEIQTILKSNFGLELTLENICEVMISTKIAREKHKHKEDNITDLINYHSIYQHLK